MAVHGDLVPVGVRTATRTAVKAIGGSIVARLEGLARSATPRSPVGTSGILQVGGFGTYQVTTYNFERVVSSVVYNPTGYRCLQALEHNLSRPAWAVFRDDEMLDNNPILLTLNRPAEKVSGTMLQRQIARDTELTGKFFAVKMRGRDGFGDTGPVTGLRRLPPQRVAVVGNQDDELLGFIYTDRAGQRTAALPDAMVYIRYPHPERDYDGLAPAVIAGLPSEIDNAAARFNYDLLANDGALPGYIVVNGLTPDEFAEWKLAWESGEYPGKTRFLSGDASYVRVGSSNKDMMQDALREFSQTDIQKAFGVPPVHAMDLSRETYANANAENDVFVSQTCLGKWTLWADELTVQLGEEAGVRIGFDLDDIEELQESRNDAVSRVVALAGADVITRDEARDEVGYDPAGIEFPTNAPAEATEPASEGSEGSSGAGGPTGTPGKGTVPTHTKASRGEVRVVFHRRVAAWEGRVARKMEVYFGRQGRVVEARLRSSSGKSLTKAIAQDRWWDAARWDEELADDAGTFLADVVDAFGTQVMFGLVGAGPTAFDARADSVARYLGQRSTDIARLVNGTTADDIRSIIANLEPTGATIDRMADAIRDYFIEQSAMRAERVARTEVIGAANFATIEAARQSGIATGKTWLATADESTDEDCAALDGTTVGLEDSFGDVDQPPLHPNCRCTVLIETASGTTTEGDEE